MFARVVWHGIGAIFGLPKFGVIYGTETVRSGLERTNEPLTHRKDLQDGIIHGDFRSL